MRSNNSITSIIVSKLVCSIRKSISAVSAWPFDFQVFVVILTTNMTDFQWTKFIDNAPSDSMLVAAPGERNKQHILDVLEKYLSPVANQGLVFEVASGPGQHVSHFALRFPSVRWQPSDCDPACLNSIKAHIEDKGLKNVLPPLNVDITKPTEQWASPELKPGSCDVVLNINMVHISPWEASVGLFRVAGSLLKPGGYLFMYGPFKVDGVLTPDSNVRFDSYLRSQDSRWGIRDVVDLDKLAKENGLTRKEMVDMPANNKCTIFKKEI